MKARIQIASIILLFVVPLAASEKDDIVIMKNGDRLTCQIKGLESGVLYISLDYVDGTMAVQWSKVAKIESKHPHIVKTEDGSVYRGILSTAESPADRPMRLQVAENPGKGVVLERPQIISMAETSDKFWRRFNGAVNLGVIASKGNASTQFSLGAQVDYLRERWSAAVDYNSSLSSSSGATTSTQNQLNLGAQRLLRWKNYFYSGFGGFMQSSEQGINLQSSLGGTVGRFLKNTDHSRFSIAGGLAWQRTDYRQTAVPLDTQDLAAAALTAHARFFKFKKTNFDLNAILFPAISELGRVRFNGNAYYYIKIFLNLSWNISAYFNWDNRPPLDLPGSSYGASSGLSWTFGLK
jgi:hypothetical protein